MLEYTSLEWKNIPPDTEWYRYLVNRKHLQDSAGHLSISVPAEESPMLWRKAASNSSDMKRWPYWSNTMVLWGSQCKHMETIEKYRNPKSPKPWVLDLLDLEMMRWKFMISWFMLGKCASRHLHVFFGSRWRGNSWSHGSRESERTSEHPWSSWSTANPTPGSRSKKSKWSKGSKWSKWPAPTEITGSTAEMDGNGLYIGNIWKNAPWLKRSQVFHSYFKRCFSDRRAALYPSSLTKMLAVGETIHLCWWNDPTCDACL